MFYKNKTAVRNDGVFNKRLYIAAIALGLLGAMFLIAVSKGSARNAPEGYSALEIVNTVSSRVYYRRLLKDRSEFAIEFIHSVNNSPVLEFFKIEDKKIKPAAVHFHSFGAGMPSELEEGQQMEIDGDTVIITGFNKEYTELNYIIGTVSDHLLIINEERISLRELCGRNAHITLRITQ